jgi:hypothetical protein
MRRLFTESIVLLSGEAQMIAGEVCSGQRERKDSQAPFAKDGTTAAAGRTAVMAKFRVTEADIDNVELVRQMVLHRLRTDTTYKHLDIVLEQHFARFLRTHAASPPATLRHDGPVRRGEISSLDPAAACRRARTGAAGG